MCVCDDLPPRIVPVVHAFVQQLVQHLARHRDQSLAVHEAALLTLWRATAGALLSSLLTVATTGADRTLRPPRRACPHCGQSGPAERWRPRQIRTCVGAVTFERTLYLCAGCGHRWAAADATLGLEPRQQSSAQVTTWEAWVGGLTTFREATRLLATLAGVVVGRETLRTHAEQHGTALAAVQQAQQAHVAATQEPLPGTHEPAPGRLVVETDGVFVRYRCPPACPSTWHEMKLGIVGGWVGARPTATLQVPSYVAAREAVEDFAPRLAAEAVRRGALDIVGWQQPSDTDPRLAGVTGPALAVLRPLVVLGDGARWIWESVAPQFANERVEIVDWYHSTEHLWDLAKALYGGGTLQAAHWEQQAETRLWEHGAGALLAFLTQTTAATPAALQALETERGYFARNAARMQYPRFRQQGLPIGSGAVESTAKYLVQQRMKRAGMRWTPDGAQAIVHLRCHSLTEDARTAPPHRPHAHSAKAA